MTGISEYRFAGFNLARDIVHTTAVEKGWWEPQPVKSWEASGIDVPEKTDITVQRSFGELIALVHSEASEALEEYRNGKDPLFLYFPSAGAHGPVPSTRLEAENWAGSYGWKPEGVPAELADIIIRVLDICGHYGIDIEHALRVKAAYNETRSHRHGGKKL